LELANEIAEVQRLIGGIQDFGRRNHLPEPLIWQFVLALDELVTNVISYAYDDQARHWIKVILRLENGSWLAEVIDDGRAYDPLERPPVDVAADITARPIGGLGVHIVKQLMDVVAYQRRDGRNYLSLAKTVCAKTASAEAASEKGT